MSIAYASTSFVASSPTSSGSQSRSQSPRPESSRHHRQTSRSSQISGSSTVHEKLPSPATAVTHTSIRNEQLRAQYDQIGAFFGGGRHRSGDEPSRVSMTTNTRSEEGHSPPSYILGSDIETLPSYARKEDDALLSRKLFKYGFLFFPLWIIGALVPFVKTFKDKSPENCSKEEQETGCCDIREAEIRWAKRCGIALAGLTSIVLIAVVIGVTVSKHT